MKLGEASAYLVSTQQQGYPATVIRLEFAKASNILTEYPRNLFNDSTLERRRVSFGDLKSLLSKTPKLISLGYWYGSINSKYQDLTFEWVAVPLKLPEARSSREGVSRVD